jgi:hypothetical protein
VNVVFLLLSTAVSAGADAPAQIKPAAPPATAAAPVAAPIATNGCGCGGCGAISDCCSDGCCENVGLFARLRGRFGRKGGCCEADCGCGGCGGNGCGAGAYGAGPGLAPGQIQPGQPGGPERLKMPKGEGEKGKDQKGGKETATPTAPVLTPTGAKVETEVKNPFELARRYEKRVSRAADYSKLTGQLFYVHTDGGLWVLRYAPLSQEDANGGSVILARDRKMDSYREGDLVSVEGRILNQKGSAHLGGALYRVQSISLVDRPQP